MKGFDSKEGLIHFLFAEEDDYYLDCLLKLDLTHFIYYKLKKQKYDGIYFLKSENTVKTFLGLGSKEEISVYCMDQKSTDVFPMDAGYLGGTIYKNEKTQKNHKLYCIRGKKESIVSRIQTLMKQREKYAFIIPISMIQNLLCTGTFHESLKNAVNEKKGNCMIALAASKSAEDSFEELFSLAEEYPFLFKEVADILESREKLPFYQTMNLKYGNRMQIWNQMDQKSVSDMLRRMIVEGSFKGDTGNWKAYADLLYVYTRDTETQRELKPFREKESAYSLQAMRKSLDSDKTWDKINRLLEKESIESWKRKVKDVQQWKRDVRYPVFTRAGSTLNAVNILWKELENQRTNGVHWDDNCLRVQRIMDHVRTPWNASNDYEDIEAYVTQCVVQMKKYINLYKSHSKDLRYSPVTAIINDIWYKIADSNSYYKEEEIEKEKQIKKEKQQTYDALIRTSVTLMECLNNYDQQKQEMNYWSQELNQNLEESSRLNGSIDKELHMKDSVFVANQKLRLRELDTNIHNSEEWIERYRKSNEVLLRNIQNLKKALESANLSLSHWTGESTAEMAKLLEQLNNLNSSTQKQMTEADIAGQELKSEMQSMEKMYESHKMEEHIYGI